MIVNIKLFKVLLFSVLVGFVLIVFSGCTKKFDIQSSGTDSTMVISQVKKATWAFHAADTSRDAEAVVALLWPEYTMLADGSRLTYEQAASGSREFMTKLKLFHSEWSDLKVIPIRHDAAVASFHFRDSIIYKNGELIRNQGTTSFVWQRRNGEWKVLYADANHRPIEP